MKKLTCIFCFIFACAASFSQTKNNISFYYGFASDFKTHNLTGDWQNPRNSYAIDLSYSHILYKSFSIETGLEYSKHTIETGFDAEPDRPFEYSDLHLLCIPIYLMYTFLKYFFLNSGISLDYDFNRAKTYPMDDQSGIGLGIGIGGEFRVNNINFTVNPLLKCHSVIPFNKNNYTQQNLVESGIKFGIGYNF
jgi:hypothetical protein